MKSRFSVLPLVKGFVAILVLNGCATVPELPPVKPDASLKTIPAIAPSTSAVFKADLSIERWWVLFGDEALNRLMEEALVRNTDLELAVARVHEARAGLDAAGAALWPQVDLKAQGGREQRSEVSAMPLPPGMARETDSRGVALQTSYEIDLWGRLSAGTDAARSRLLATEWARAAVEWSLTARVAESYFALAAVDRQIEISEAVRAGRQATVDLRRREHAVGAGNEFDLRRAEAELTGTEATLAALARRRVALDGALTLLLGRNPAEIATGTIERRVLDESLDAVAVLPRGDVAELLSRRPDIRQAEAELAAANAEVEVARTAALPSLRLTGAVGSDAKSVADLFSGPAAIWSLAAGITQSIIDGGRAGARARGEHARARQVLAGYRKTINSAVLDVREAYATLDLTEQAYRAEHARVTALGRAKDIARTGFDAGALSYLDLLDAERNLYQAQLQKVDAYRDQLVGQVAAFKALGGGYAASSLETVSIYKKEF